MTSIQGILIVGCLFATLLGSVIFRTKLAYRLLAILLCLAAVIFVLFPDFTTVIAKSLGVGRGTDLLLYVSLVTGIHAILLLYRRTRDLERKITAQIRAMALRDVQEIQK